ncbi:hypothetical protein, partial [Acidovorax sp.]|uniref:hypothetical protein n=1 Tax=Acidovorax sp. TaxID=1872122 RepID=UPI0025870436
NQITKRQSCFIIFTPLRSAEPQILARFLKNRQTFENFLSPDPGRLQQPDPPSEALNYIPGFYPVQPKTIFFFPLHPTPSRRGLTAAKP